MRAALEYIESMQSTCKMSEGAVKIPWRNEVSSSEFSDGYKALLAEVQRDIYSKYADDNIANALKGMSISFAEKLVLDGLWGGPSKGDKKYWLLSRKENFKRNENGEVTTLDIDSVDKKKRAILVYLRGHFQNLLTLCRSKGKEADDVKIPTTFGIAYIFSVRLTNLLDKIEDLDTSKMSVEERDKAFGEVTGALYKKATINWFEEGLEEGLKSKAK